MTKKTYKPTKLYTTASLLKQYKRVFSEEQFYFINLIIKKAEEADDDGYVALSAQHLTKQLGESVRKRVVQPLIDKGVVEVFTSKEGKESYAQGTRSKRYRLKGKYAEEVRKEQLSFYTAAKDSNLSRRLFKFRAEDRNKAISSRESFRKQYEMMCRLEFDSERAYEMDERFSMRGYREKNKPFTKMTKLNFQSNMEVLSQLSYGDFHFSFNGVRLSTCITSAMREARKCLMDDKGNQMVELDIRSSQPLFLCKALYYYHVDGLNKNYVQRLDDKHFADHPYIEKEFVSEYSDTRAFINEVVYGDIYKRLFHDYNLEEPEWEKTDMEGIEQKSYSVAGTIPLKDTDRGGFKKMWNRDIMFNYHTRKQVPKVYKVFKEDFPSVAHFLEIAIGENPNAYKRSRPFALMLQNYESFFVHHIALEDLLRAFPERLFYTVHDSIGVPEDILDEAQEIMQESLKGHLGIKGNAQLVSPD